MISSLMKIVMKECGLSQKELADVLGATIDRVKGITSGRVKKLTREEGEALIKKLHIRGDWLATGEGPMKQSPGEIEFQRRLSVIKSTTERVAALGLPVEKAQRLHELLSMIEIGNTQRIAEMLEAPLAPDETTLVDNYRHCPPEGKAALKTTSAALAQSKCNKKAG